MSVAKMKFAKVNGPLSVLNKFLASCCTDGNFQPEPALKYLSGTMGFKAYSEDNQYAPLLQKIEELAANNPSQKKLSLVGNTMSMPIEESDKAFIDELGNEISALRDQQHELDNRLNECVKDIERFSHFTGLGVDLQEVFGCRFIDTRFGRLPKENYNKLMAYSDNPYLLFVPCSSDASDYWGVYCAPHNRINEIDRIFAGLHFEKIEISDASGSAEEIVDELTKEISAIKKKRISLDDEIISIWNNQGAHCNTIYTQLVILNSIYELSKYAAHDNSYFFYVGWVPVEYTETLKKRVKKLPGLSLELSDPDEDDETPVKLKNPRIFRPFEYYVGMYGLPSYTDMDVTPFMAVTYTLLFGIMFADVGQGLVLFALGLIGWKLKKIAIARIIIPCGAASTLFGFVFGSVFGYEEMLDPVYHALGMAGKPLSVMDSINTVLLFAIGIGVALVTVAMLLNIYTCLRQKHFGAALFSENGLTGIFFYLSAVAFAVAFMGGKRILPNKILFLVMGVCAVILYLKELLIAVIDKEPEKKPTSIGDFLLQNIFEVIEYVLSYFSNTVSFLRVGAFVIVHASMMMVVFTLGGDGKNIPVIIIGNIIVIALEGLLTGIQGLRLEFYEMFSRFYDGSGKPFTALKIETPKVKKPSRFKLNFKNKEKTGAR